MKGSAVRIRASALSKGSRMRAFFVLEVILALPLDGPLQTNLKQTVGLRSSLWQTIAKTPLSATHAGLLRVRNAASQQ